jgi:hypothetical protein
MAIVTGLMLISCNPFMNKKEYGVKADMNGQKLGFLKCL